MPELVWAFGFSLLMRRPPTGYPVVTAPGSDMNDIAKLLEAAAFAAKRHTGHFRKGQTQEPYINHPLEVANLLANVGGIVDIDVLIAAVLHDTVEDVGVKKEEIEAKYGTRVAEMVAEVTDDRSLPKAERKRLQVEHAPHLSPGAKLIKLADKISNITDITNSPPADWDAQRRREYIDWGESVVAGLRGTDPALESKFDDVVHIAREKLT
jgi:GTP diphosphokinase / guanosine-3',5'-bis(diphosphate) 3'-diphosphatase